MATYKVAVNMEFVRSADMDFRAGVKVAAELGYRWIEPISTRSRWKKTRC